MLRIPVEPLGFRAPGKEYMLLRLSFLTLDFIDAQHLLFTFHQTKLLHRETDAEPFDDDQTIKAVVLELPSGTPQATAEWRMHDRAPYLWVLDGGRVLVRRRNRYFITDASLKLSPYIDAETRVATTEVSPDGKVIVVENDFERHSPDAHHELLEHAMRSGMSPPAEDTMLNVIDAESRAVLARFHLQKPVNLPVTDGGYIATETRQGKNDTDKFDVSFDPYPGGKGRKLGVVASTCVPHENLINSDIVLITSCGPSSSDAYLDAWATDGRPMWQGRRESRLVWPTLATSLGGKRFALGLLRIAHTIDLESSLDEDAVKEQVVHVFDSATGALRLATAASPIITAGRNFALSPDGDRLAVLHNGAIEVFEVGAGPAVAQGK